MHKVANISAFLHYYFVACSHLWTAKWLHGRFLVLFRGDVEINLGLRYNAGESFSICRWNLNSVFAYNYTKLFSLKSFVHTSSQIWYYQFVRWWQFVNLRLYLSWIQHHSNNKRKGTSVYHNNFLPLRCLDI